MAGIFHDFNFKYYFSALPMYPSLEKYLNDQMPMWLERAMPIVSTRFMKTEIQKFYPAFGDKVKVVPIAPMSHVSVIREQRVQEVLKKFHLPRTYLLCPTQIIGHKNAGPLIAAQAILRQQGFPVVLVFTGAGTEGMSGRSCAIGVERRQLPQDVFGLGYVTNEEVDALIQGAAIVVNSSLYEGGNGPGFDAWGRGVPVAMSRIPTFLEHLEEHDVRAQIFDPRSPEDIAEKLKRILADPAKAAEDAAYSQNAISQFTWERSAQGYLQIIDEVISESRAKISC
jgi:glycosyltransferase involved in cell wall biosynthesis